MSALVRSGISPLCHPYTSSPRIFFSGPARGCAGVPRTMDHLTYGDGIVGLRRVDCLHWADTVSVDAPEFSSSTSQVRKLMIQAKMQVSAIHISELYIINLDTTSSL